MKIYYSDNEKIDFLLLRGYIYMESVEYQEHNAYQNVFLSNKVLIEKMIKDGIEYSIDDAFYKEIKNKILHF
ncbi:hypothetical protein [Sphingobacterium spiritivorum]|uniref:hypothetical protein n=1 Tax=Sphingobacterium spiritivorum TaxID=258 RepID=UPI003DA533DC